MLTARDPSSAATPNDIATSRAAPRPPTSPRPHQQLDNRHPRYEAAGITGHEDLETASSYLDEAPARQPAPTATSS
ncbi:hypothetical protein Shyd_42360 [Streptomyces hydrogenans]|uniref:Integrase n=1 Tax=Streptomyces hydrogenans TaxID=1873719 RepID=A0ABQ3PCX1_9ACTN|nr:hypothetical protein Shyd_42360 [Streptomyces hydrogenans]